MKVGTDGVLLGAWAPVEKSKRILDIGTGSGLVAIMMAQRSDAEIVGVELDPEASSQALENAQNSPYASRIQIINADILEFSSQAPFDTIVSNPPFFENSLACPEEGRNRARHTSSLPLNALIESAFFAAERAKIDEAQAVCDETQGKLDELVEEHTAEGGILADYLNDKDAVDAKAVNAKIKELKKIAPDSEEYRILCEYTELCDKAKKYTKLVKDLNAALDEACKAKYAELTIDEIKELLVNRKWYYTIFEGIKVLYVTASHNMIAGCAMPMRSIHITGTKGEIWGVHHEEKYTLRKIDHRPGCEYSEEIIDVHTEGGIGGAHGGGDDRLTEDFVSYIQGGHPSISCTSITDSVNGHLCVYLADKARETNQVMPVVKKA
mgnify:CR=1 FL=1